MTEPVKTLDDELQQWLTEHDAELLIVAIGPAKGIVTIDNFVTADGIKLPARWCIGATAVEVKEKSNGASGAV